MLMVTVAARREQNLGANMQLMLIDSVYLNRRVQHDATVEYHAHILTIFGSLPKFIPASHLSHSHRTIPAFVVKLTAAFVERRQRRLANGADQLLMIPAQQRPLSTGESIDTPTLGCWNLGRKAVVPYRIIHQRCGT